MFENWLKDYDILSSFAKHYKTGEVLPKEMFEKEGLPLSMESILSLR